MLKVIETKGDTIDAAIEKALVILQRERDDVSVEVLQNPKSGFLGIGREQAVIRVSYETSPAAKAQDFVEGLLYRLGASADVLATENRESRVISLELSGSDMGAVIGRRGDTLDAIQYLAGIVANRDEPERWRVTVDTENYRAKRESALEALAQKTAQRALKYKKAVALEPMSPHDRRIVHTLLQDTPGVTTYSTGTEPNRRVIVSPEGVPGETRPSAARDGAGTKSGQGGQGGAPRRRRRRRSGGPKPESKPDAKTENAE